VDLCLFTRGVPPLRLSFQPDELRKLGVPEETITAAGKCDH
jgi:hypothetical protein